MATAPVTQEVGLVPTVLEDCTSANSSVSAMPLRSRPPTLQLIRNFSDQRVPEYLDQTVPVWSLLQEAPAAKHFVQVSSSDDNMHASNRLPGRVHERDGGLGGQRNAKVARRGEPNTTAWLRTFNDALSSGANNHHDGIVGGRLHGCCKLTTPQTPSCRWSGIEQDLFTSTAVDAVTLSKCVLPMRPASSARFYDETHR